ncbi:Small-conductance mechanosensitive channel [Halopelagius inordinatus]|uniref:Small-conductance mechanosensitive channel n=1 Tax=Halopelagius inordinatus TaxID=553467 RepID=A0A1I2UT98_9EURY|nr:mechanosensitive ion channel family protein [Halopelagius inordinatus]SFG80345.1 Small-conductance mechanosensitive channel [Halopelagius inordinatus]
MSTRRLGYGSLALALVFSFAAAFVAATALFGDATLGDQTLNAVVRKVLTVGTVLSSAYGVYALVTYAISGRFESKRRVHDARNVLRLCFGAVAAVGVLGVLTEEWVGVLFSLGVVGFAITFALQQPILSLIGWFYIMLKRPFAVGERIEVEETRGDVIEVGFLATELWEIHGHLVTTNQPSGRVVTVPNSQFLTSQVKNYSTLFEYVWSELTVQVAYETDLAFARQTMADVADDYLGDEMEDAITMYRRRLAQTPVDLDVPDRPTVNIVQKESWVELHLRFLSPPRGVTGTRNALYERIFEEFDEHDERIKFPLGRNR